MIADSLALALMVLIEGALLLFIEPVDVPAKWEVVSLLAAGDRGVRGAHGEALRHGTRIDGPK